MQVIFESNLVPEIREKHVLLELDTVKYTGLTKPLTLYALIEDIDIIGISDLPLLITQHQEFIDAYKKNSNWEDAIANLNSLIGKWNGQLDSFYNFSLEKSKEFQLTNASWNGIVNSDQIEVESVETFDIPKNR